MPIDPAKERLLHDLPWAFVLAGNNELKIRAKTRAEGGAEAADACGLRFQVPRDNLAGSGWLAAIFADVMDGTTERVQFKLGIVMDPGPMLVAYATRLGGQEDGDEILLFKFGLDGAYVRGLSGGAAAPAGVPSRFQSDDGRYVYNVQGDPTTEFPYGRIVQYRVSDMQPVAILRPEPL